MSQARDRASSFPSRAGRVLRAAVAAVLLLAPAGPAGGSSGQPALDPRAWTDTLDGKVGDFIVTLRGRAEPAPVALSAADPDTARAGYVAGLTETAAADQAGLLAQLDRLGATYRSFWIVNAVAVHGDRAVLAAMAARGDVLRIEADRPFSVDLPQAQADEGSPGDEPPWGLAFIGAPDLWARGVRGDGLVFASADTGVQWDHPALLKAYRGWDGTQAEHNYNWWDAIHADIDGSSANPCGLESPEPCDDYGHGTHTTGIAVGEAVGVAPGARWMACRNMDHGVGRPSTYIECLQFFTAPTDLNGENPEPSRAADVINNSYGCPPEEQCESGSLHDAVEAVRAAGIFMAVSAGNDGSGCATVHTPPATEASVFTVGAVAQDGTIANISSRGPVTIDGSDRLKPDLTAPGVNIWSSTLDGGYGQLTGTSMAAPHVAGSVLLLWSTSPGLRGQVAATEDLLRHSAVQAATTTQTCGDLPAGAWPNNVYGYGVVDALAAYLQTPEIWRLYLPSIWR